MRAISSIYGFILIFLLSMASIQTWSSAVGSMESVQSAADQGHELEQLQQIEHLSLSLSAGNLTITNDGQVPSTVEYLRLVGENTSRTLPLSSQLGVGESITTSVPAGYEVEAVTSLGNVFDVSPTSNPPGSVWTGGPEDGAISGAQVFQNPYDPSLVYVSSGADVSALYPSGALAWTFDGGSGLVTDVMPLAGGDVFVSVGYATSSNAALLYELDGSGAVVASYPVRLFVSPQDQPASSSQPVAKGQDEDYAFYDGWFFSGGGPIGSISGDSGLLASTDSNDFYVVTTTGVPDLNGSCQSRGNEMSFYSYTAGENFAGGFRLNWSDDVYLGSCNRYPQQLIGSGSGGGAVAALFADPYYSSSQNDYYAGENPYIVVLSDSGSVVYQGLSPSPECSAIATDGSQVFLALPQAGEIDVLNLASGSVTTYAVGMEASSLIWQDGFLFAVSDSGVRVFDGSMAAIKTIDLAPLSLSSASNPLPAETALHSPSFLVLNSTSYAALARNATGYDTLIIGRYA